MRAAHEPTLPKPWTTQVRLGRREPELRRRLAEHVDEAAARSPTRARRSPRAAIGLPVTIAGVWPLSLPYSSISQAITWALVLTSGAMMSRFGPSTFWILSMNERVIACSSAAASSSPGQLTPPFAPP